MEGQAGHQQKRATIADSDSRARTHLANERTFLAWLRTALNLIVLGLAVAQFVGPADVANLPLASVFGVGLVLSGVLLTLVAGGQYHRSRDQIDRGAFRAPTTSVVASVALVALAGLLALGIVLRLTQVMP